MLKNEWLQREKEFVDNSDKKYFKALYSHINSFLQDFNNTIEIEDSKTVEDCYKKMKKYAENNRDGGSCYCFTDDEEKDFILSYLNLKIEHETKIINLSDFI